MKLRILISIFFIAGFSSLAQDKSFVQLKAKAKKNSILLRWGPSDPMIWLQGNRSGYVVERFTITRGNQLLRQPERALLATTPIKPKPLEVWRADATSNDYSAIAAEAIYSSSFDVSGPAGGLATIVNKSEELEQRFSFVLFAADQSFETAKLSGLALEDNAVKPDEKYLYRVFIRNVNSKVKIDTGIFYISLKDTTSAVAPTGLRAEFRNRQVKLTWPKSFLQNEYSSFIIERALAQDRVFARINKVPFVNFIDPKEPNFQFVDSLPANGVRYIFRVRGITVFGEQGPPSEEVSGAGFKNIRATASIREAYESSPGKISVGWNLTGDQSTIKEIVLQRSNRTDGKYVRVNKTKIDFATRSFLDDEPYPTSYYRLKVVGEQDSIFSFPYLAQLVDSIPPIAPDGLTGSIDQKGQVILSWKPNREKDLLGYRVFRSNFLNSEFSQITKDPVEEEKFVDSVELKSLTKTVYYKIVAVDQRFNPSSYSKILKLEKPDVVPPSSPVLKSVIQKRDRIEVSWIPGPSPDIAKNILMRRAKGQQWITVRELPHDSIHFSDQSPDQKVVLEYSLVAVDSAGNRSVQSQSLSVANIPTSREWKNEIIYSVDRSSKSITIRWGKVGKEVSKILVYRSEGDDPISLYRTLTSPVELFIDNKLVMDKRYTYRMRAVYKDGTESLFSERLSAKY